MFGGADAGAGRSPALAEPPHYVSQRGDLAYLREGPSYQHKIVWVYRHRGYPFAGHRQLRCLAAGGSA